MVWAVTGGTVGFFLIVLLHVIVTTLPRSQANREYHMARQRVDDVFASARYRMDAAVKQRKSTPRDFGSWQEWL